jgi:hypothetical protein
MMTTKPKTRKASAAGGGINPKMLALELPWARVRVATSEPETLPVLRMSWADIAVASLLPALFIATAVAMWIKG